MLEFKNYTKKTWGVMKELIGKIRNTESTLPKSFLLKKTEMKDVAEEFKIIFYKCWTKFSRKCSKFFKSIH